MRVIIFLMLVAIQIRNNNHACVYTEYLWTNTQKQQFSANNYALNSTFRVLKFLLMILFWERDGRLKLKKSGISLLTFLSLK